MFIDHYDFNHPITFEYKERKPRWLYITSLIFAFMTFIWLCIFFGFVLRLDMPLSKDQIPSSVCIFFIIWLLFGILVAILHNHFEQFDFYYIVTFDEKNFSIGIPIKGSIQTEHFSREVAYKFKEKSRLVYMRSIDGVKYDFRYDENFRKFLEEIQIK